MNYKLFKYEGWLYGLAFLLAFALRLIGLGHMPLSDSEARLALQSLHLASGLKPVLGPHPAYVLFTMPLFFLYGGGSNVLARLIPALVGSMLVFAPVLFQNRIKPRPSLLFAFFIALDPGLVAISRQAGSSILAITFLVLAFGFFNKNNFRWAGIFAALALLGGPSIWAGLVGIVISLGIYQLAKLRFSKADNSSTFNLEISNRNDFLISLAATLLIAGTLFFLVPNGLSAALSSIPVYLGGWRAFSKMDASWLLISLLVYQPFAVVLSIIAIIRGWINGSRRIVILSVWFLVSLLLVVFYPARQITDLAWVLIPLYAMSALELARYINILPEERAETAGAILLTAFLWIFGWLNYASMVWSAPGQPGFNQHLLLVVGSIFLLILSIVLVAFGWSIRIAQLGLIWGLGLSLGILSLAGTFGVTGMRGLSKPEMWWPLGVPSQSDLLVSTVDNLSQWGQGYNNAVPVVMIGIDSPALEWALREHSPTVASSIDPSAPPALVVSANNFDPNTISPYRGEGFEWRATTSWQLAQPADWFKWVAYREMIQTPEKIILWARNDLFINKAP